MRRILLAGLAGFAAVALVSCAEPAVTRYTLGSPGPSAAAPALGRALLVIEVARVAIPDELDTQDILVRRGSTLERSHGGRWASRLSVGVTERLAARLSQSRPDALVTDEPQGAAPDYRILIHVSALDVVSEGAGGRATLAADWLIVPRDARLPTARDRVRLEAAGPVATDRETVALVTEVVDRLAGAIDIAGLR